MEKQEIIEIMSKPLSTARAPMYRQIYKQATGKEWRGCFCGNGWENFTRVCKNYAELLKKQI